MIVILERPANDAETAPPSTAPASGALTNGEAHGADRGMNASTAQLVQETASGAHAIKGVGVTKESHMAIFGMSASVTPFAGGPARRACADNGLEMPVLPLDCLALILHHLPSVRDRCIAMSCSSEWRQAGCTDASLWREIVLTVFKRLPLRDAHVDSLILRADGQVRELTLGFAPELTRWAFRALRFNRELQTFSVHAPLLSGTDILEILPRDASRLTNIHIFGCSVDARELRLIQAAVNNEICKIDIEICEGCDAVAEVHALRALDCAGCGDTCCAQCVGKECSVCNVSWCSECTEADEADALRCEKCAVTICVDCADEGLISSCSLCPCTYCRECVDAELTIMCSHCDSWVCERCVPRLTPCTACGASICCGHD